MPVAYAVPSNRRTFYATQAVGIAPYAAPTTYTAVRGLQTMGVNTKFNLEQIFEMGQLAIYENVENLPDCEISMEKCLDGYCPIYLLATSGASDATLIGRSNQRANIAMNVYADNISGGKASGNPITQCVMSGVYPSQIGYEVSVNGPSKETISFVGNNKVWSRSTFVFTGMSGAHGVSSWSPLAPEGVNFRENIVMTGCVFPNSLPGISGNANHQNSSIWDASIQSIKVSSNLGRDQLLELGRKGPYFRYVQFPTEVTTVIEIISKDGDLVECTEDGILGNNTNLVEEPIKIVMKEGLVLDMGTKNMLSSSNLGGANAGARGGNATTTLSYTNFNDLSVSHPRDPTVALRP